MSLLGDIITASVKGIKFNPRFYEDKNIRFGFVCFHLQPANLVLICMANYICPKTHHQDFLNCTKIVLVLLYGLNPLKRNLYF